MAEDASREERAAGGRSGAAAAYGEFGPALLASLVDNSEDAIIGKTLDGVVTSWNRAAAEMFGFTAEEMVGRTLEPLFPPGTFGEEAAILARLGGGERIRHYETVRVRKDGARLNVSLSVSPIRDAEGRIVGASKIVRDITRETRMTERLDELQAELLHVSRLNDMGQMAAALAHELNQPLSAVATYISGVRRLLEAGNTGRALEGCDRATDQVKRAAEVIRRLRSLVKKETGERRLEPLSEAVEEAANLALLASRSETMTTRYDFSSEAPTAMMDRVQVQQVVLNLVRNAAEALAPSPRRELAISTEPAGAGMVLVAVADSGPGISPEVKARLFTPFVTTKETGMGVGLSLCRSIIEAHGGEIWADDNPGGGAVFRFTLPAA